MVGVDWLKRHGDSEVGFLRARLLGALPHSKGVTRLYFSGEAHDLSVHFAEDLQTPGVGVTHATVPLIHVCLGMQSQVYST